MCVKLDTDCCANVACSVCYLPQLSLEFHILIFTQKVVLMYGVCLFCCGLITHFHHHFQMHGYVLNIHVALIYYCDIFISPLIMLADLVVNIFAFNSAS